MFVVGGEYQFRMIENGGECTFLGEVSAVEGTLIKLASPGGGIKEQIINTASSNFVSAELQPHRSADEKAASAKQFQELIVGLTEQRSS